MQLREYTPSDCAQLAELFYQTVHSVNAKDYTQEQLDAWATGEVDLQAWDKSFRALWRHGWKRLSGQAVCPQGASVAGYCICDLRRIGALCGRKDIHDARFHHGKAVFPASRILRCAPAGSDPARRCAHEFCDEKGARGQNDDEYPEPECGLSE